jgi:hypothetical protein
VRGNGISGQFFNFAALMARVRAGTKVTIENGARPMPDALVRYHSNNGTPQNVWHNLAKSLIPLGGSRVIPRLLVWLRLAPR